MKKEKYKLFKEAILKYILGIIIIGLLIFIPAGSISYIQGWIFMGILFIPMFFAGIVMLNKNPELLRSRLDAKEKEKDQDIIIKLSALMFLIGFIIAGLNYRFQWNVLSLKISLIAAIVFMFSYLLYAEVLRENTYLSRTIKVQENQKVVDSGLYGFVRHPMYSVTILLFMSMPIVLGSMYSFIIFLVYPIIIAKRIKGEEDFLKEELDGYEDYMKRVKYRLFPFIW